MAEIPEIPEIPDILEELVIPLVQKGKIQSTGSLLVQGVGRIDYIGDETADINQLLTYNRQTKSIETTEYEIVGTLPPGAIIIWYGSIRDIPKNWYLCNGQTANGKVTPDLRARFVIGAETENGVEANFDPLTGDQTGAYGVDSIGGEIAHQLTIPELPTHVHEGGAEPGPGGPGVGARVVPTQPTGEDNYHENRPPYYALAYIMFSPVDYRPFV